MIHDIAPDTVIDERYVVLSRIGSGGMAEVYVAQDRQLGRKVALKLLHRRFAEDAEFVERFRREASSAASLQHPNVVSVYDRGSWDGTYYIAMEYLEGRSLKQLIRDEAPLAPERAIDLTIQILKAARFAHKRGVIHRDLKPHNAIVDEEDRLKVTDFGIARAGASDMTETGSIMGTAQYLSPEQAQGQAVGAASDLYSVGVVLFEMLTGRVPFDAESAVTIALQHVSLPPESPRAFNPDITPELEAVVLRALAKEPAERFADADEFIAALESAREHLDGGGGDGVQSTSAWAPVSTPTEEEDEERRGWQRRWLWIALVALLLIGGGVAAYALTRPEQVAVPDVVGQDENAATTRLETAGFSVDTRTVTDTSPREQVIRQSPQPRTKVDAGSNVVLTVSGGPGQATVPPVEGLTEKSAAARIEKAGLKAESRERSSSGVDKGRVISSSPEAGVQVERGSTVQLSVSTGPKQEQVPNVVGQNVADARAALGDLGLNASVTEQESADQDPGTVLSQQPQGGATVARGSTVALTVAKEPAQVHVPDLVGEDQDAAANALTDLGLEVRFRRRDVSDEADDGVVLSQNPPAGRKADKGARVTLTIGRFTAPTATSPSTPQGGGTP